ncbi:MULTISPECIES: ABC transporter permease [Peptoniphilus]|uniref:ABC transporter permease n=1 Tax=Peptoniphilus TaxID=162289 RepID=UPI000289ABF6|nr:MULTISPECIES: ABC transporter permease [Peptoniphilus]MBS6611067.1 ABC transporter permease [Peptoniphilus harei]MDU1044135.1 ABC transporter permease [Peptoniphilus rhinitidis]MDU1955297.1 ABC transporter permease [Peptoniphilus lacydonensis]MDU2109981.1 ABC transporter permease [Peptoniphilus lacydonensis]MDU2114997.1 ABC transporter permease [Peptoniphilus lacydonensis]
MDLSETIKLSLEGLKANKLRSFLTMLGIIIGIGSVIGITTIGDSLTKSVNKAFDMIANTAVQLYVTPRDSDYDTGELSERDYFTENIINYCESQKGNRIEKLLYHGASGQGYVKEGREKERVEVNSTSEDEKSIFKINMIAGRFLNDEDVARGKSVAVISDKVLEKIYKVPAPQVLGREVNIEMGDKLMVATIIGVYEYEEMQVMGKSLNGSTTSLYIPRTTGDRELLSEPRVCYYDMAITLKNPDTIEEDAQALCDELNQKFYSDNPRAEVKYYSAKSEISSMNNAMSSIQVAIGAIAAISLLVGGIGVMNILLVSVTERTKEIGIRKALGATRSDIRKQFIIESIIICIIGGFFGIVLGTVIGLIGSNLLNAMTLPSVKSIIIAVGFSMLIGIFFGYYPANKAAKMNPIDALRYE